MANISAGEVWAQAAANEMILTGLLIAISRTPDGRRIVEEAFRFAEVTIEAGALRVAQENPSMPYPRLAETVEQIRSTVLD